MTLPRAVASDDGSPRDRRPRRIAVIAAVIAAAGLLVVYLIKPVPGVTLSTFGGAGGGIARYGGLRIVWQPPQGYDMAALQERLARHGLLPGVRADAPDGSIVVLEVPEVTRDEADEVAAIIGVGGGLEFREVIEGTSMTELDRMGLAYGPRRDRDRDGDEPRVDADQWRAEGDSQVHTDYYLMAHSRATLDEALTEAERRGWRPPANTIVIYERVEPWPEAKDPRPYWRTYLVVDHADLDGDAVENAYGSYDPHTNRPIVLLDFDRDGARRFGELTARIAGHKLATMLGGRVRSAPIINSAIRGGRASIAMGGYSTQAMERERDMLIKTLNAGALPPGGTVLEQHFIAPEDHAIAGVLARLAIAVVGGALAGALVWLVIWFARPERRDVAVVAGDGVASPRLAWNILAIAILMIGTEIVLPGVNENELAHIVARAGARPIDVTRFSVFALGLTPVITSFVIIELVAAIVPRLRRLRDRPEGRRKLGYAFAIAAIVVTVAQAYLAVTWIESLSRGGADVFEGGAKARWLVVATLVGGTMLLVYLAALINQRGVGNGYAVLFTAELVAGVPWDVIAHVPALHLVFAALALGAIVAIVVLMLRWRVRGARRAALPLPISGIEPLAAAGGVGVIVIQLSNLGVLRPENSLVRWLYRVDHQLVLSAGALVAFAALWAYVFARPGRRRAELARAGLEPADARSWLRALALGSAMLLAVFAIAHLTQRIDPIFTTLVEAPSLVFAIAAIADMVGELRDRRRGLVPVWPLHDPLLVDVVRDRLTAAAIPHHMQAAHVRALLWLFGPHVPVVVLVPEEHAAAAEANIRELFG